jgi:hypothetical protein
MFLSSPAATAEIESENRKAGLPCEVAYQWETVLTEERLRAAATSAGVTHGTMECTDLAASKRFYQQGLGLDVITHV